MNKDWKKFLTSQGALFDSGIDILFAGQTQPGTNPTIHPLPHLSALKVTGNDAQKFLQGQVTCNIDEIDQTQGGMGALCSAKGRVITTFFILKNTDAFLLIIPTVLMEKVIKLLQRYIMRSDVELNNEDDSLCLIGIQSWKSNEYQLPTRNYQTLHLKKNTIIYKWPSQSDRFLVLAPTQEAIEFWGDAVNKKSLSPAGSDLWQLSDINDVIPWINQQATEAFIPQYINLDRFDAISFNKGCYTGQEIISRTHYLGKVKSRMYRAECTTDERPETGNKLFDIASETDQSIGEIVCVVKESDSYKMLVVLKENYASSKKFRINNQKMTIVTIIN